MEFTPSFWLILGLTLVLGWLLGLMSRSGGGKWKRELKLERERHAAELKARDARIAELERARPTVVHDAGDSRIETLDLTQRRAEERDVHGRTVIRPSR